jgi:LmbE family N-acetylglucosaminyl deacetylase
VIELSLARAAPRLSRVLCLGAHGDDLEIGCSGTLLTLLEQNRHLAVTWVVFSARGQRAREARQSARTLLEPVKDREIVVKKFRDGFFPHDGARLKEAFEAIKARVAPDVVFTHHRDDLHQDHRVIADLTWQTFRDHLILEYEVPKYDGDLGAPNVFVPLPEPVCRRKIAHILASFPSQAGRRWFREDVFTALLRLRGLEANAPTDHAEAFYVRKLRLSSSA